MLLSTVKCCLSTTLHSQWPANPPLSRPCSLSSALITELLGGLQLLQRLCSFLVGSLQPQHRLVVLCCALCPTQRSPADSPHVSPGGTASFMLVLGLLSINHTRTPCAHPSDTRNHASCPHWELPMFCVQNIGLSSYPGKPPTQCSICTSHPKPHHLTIMVSMVCLFRWFTLLQHA